MFDSDIPWALAPSEFPDSRFSNCIIGCPHVGKRWVVSIDVGDLKYEGSNGNNTSQKRLWPPLLRSEILFFSQSIIIVNCFSLSYFFFFSFNFANFNCATVSVNALSTDLNGEPE